MRTPRLLSEVRFPFLLMALALAVASVFAVGVIAAPEEAAAPQAAPAWTGRWSEDVLRTVARIPVQDEGRVKPLHTWAGFALLASNHRRSCLDRDEEKLTPLEWFMDALFRPAHARGHRCFLIETSEVLDAIGRTDARKKKRDRYSYDEVVPTDAARAKLATLAQRLAKVAPKERTRVESGIVDLSNTIRRFEGLLGLLDFARLELKVGNDVALKARFDGKESIRFTELLAQAPELATEVRKAIAAAGGGGHTSPPAPLAPDVQAKSDVLNAAFLATQKSLPLGMFPPPGAAEPQWFAVRDVTSVAMLHGALADVHVDAMRSFEAMAASVGDAPQFSKHLDAYSRGVRELAETRGELGKIDQEVSFYELDPFGKSKVFYLIAFALIAITWLRPQLRWLELVAWGMLWLVLGLHTYGIVQRCLIRGRPPISTLYETVIFISAVGVLTMLLIEHLNRRRVALALTPIVGALGLFIAGRYEILNKSDTMPQLVAVLDTNFWLATHVTCISIGYCAGLLAGLIAHVYVLGKVFRWRSGDSAFYGAVGRMVYGVLCFALLFSLVGTILGGIWANDSWGRFWGWDPKENGALLICIVLLAVLHGRMAGIFGMFGVCQGAILAGAVVTFSWWGVNMLGIGLHSYGFTSGIHSALWSYYAAQWGVVGLGAVAWVLERRASAPQG